MTVSYVVMNMSGSFPVRFRDDKVEYVPSMALQKKSDGLISSNMTHVGNSSSAMEHTLLLLNQRSLLNSEPMFSE